MSKMPTALQQLKDYKWAKIPHLKEVEQYLLTGDAKALAKVQPKDTHVVQHRLAEALPSPSSLDEMDVRALHVILKCGGERPLSEWLERHLKKESPTQDHHAAVRAALERGNVSGEAVLDFTANYLETFARAGQPTSAGRYVLSLSDSDLRKLAEPPKQKRLNLSLIDFLLTFAIDRLEPLVKGLLDPERHWNREAAALLLLRKGGRRFEKPVAAFFRSSQKGRDKFHLGVALAELDPGKYTKPALAAARACLAEDDWGSEEAGAWLLKTAGADALPNIIAFIQAKQKDSYWSLFRIKNKLLTAAVGALGKEATPAVLAAVQTDDKELRVQALSHLLALDDGSHDALIRAELEKGLQATDAKTLNQYLPLVARWQAGPFAERLWGLLGSTGRHVREGAARALATLGDKVIPRARELLQSGRNIPLRLGAAAVLTAANTPAALRVLEERLDEEASEDVRDAMLVGLEAAWAASGRKVTRKDIDARIARAKERLEKPPAHWVDESKLPPLYYKDGTQLTREAVRYLLYRQSRTLEVRPDVEARALYDLIDRSRSADFAAALLRAFLDASKYPGIGWPVTVAALLGDDRIVPPLASHIRQWADGRAQSAAQNAVQALALLGTDAALVTIDSVALRYRTKRKNVGEAATAAFAAAAERLGLTTDELGDRVVPWLGFEPGKPRVIDCGGRKLEVRVGPDFKLKYHDLDKNKPVASLPKTAPKEVQVELKEAGAVLREVVKAQVTRLENLMVRQQRWPADRWRELFLGHPVLLPLAVRLVWGAYDAQGKRLGQFRALEDRTLTTAEDEGFELPAKCAVGAVHPLELSEDERGFWQAHLADYEIEPPFPQLERPVVRLAEDQREAKLITEHNGQEINALTFRGRAERLGWVRGEVGDGASIAVFWKSFPAAGVDALVGLEGMYIGIGMNDSIRLEDACFVRPDPERKRHSYYHAPTSESDPRLVAFKDVPPVVYSEVLGDLQKITGQKAAAEAPVEVRG
jgi:hypothetical protein